jgi:predicted protein tyrosine phosphatase
MYGKRRPRPLQEEPEGQPSRRTQRILFGIPYALTALTVVTLAVAPVDPPHVQPWLRGAAAINAILLALYLVGGMGPHYLKLLGGLFNCSVLVLGVLLLLPDNNFGGAAALLLAVHIVPAILFVSHAIWVPSLTEIVPDIFLGNRGAAANATLLQKHGITHVLNLSSSRSRGGGDAPTSHIVVTSTKRVAVHDFLWISRGSLAAVAEECLDFCDSALQPPQANAAPKHQHHRLLVHCAAGQSRSAALLLHYLMTRQGLRYTEAYSLVRRQRPVVDIHTDHLGPLLALDVALQHHKKV